MCLTTSTLYACDHQVIQSVTKCLKPRNRYGNCYEPKSYVLLSDSACPDCRAADIARKMAREEREARESQRRVSWYEEVYTREIRDKDGTWKVVKEEKGWRSK
jgi:hypothetical protein